MDKDDLVRLRRPELDDMVRDARDHGIKYSIRHFKVNPEQATTRDQVLAVATALGEEFGFDPGRGVLVEHEKRRRVRPPLAFHGSRSRPGPRPGARRALDARGKKRLVASPRSSWGTTRCAGSGTAPWRLPCKPRGGIPKSTLADALRRLPTLPA